jgi:hypothetical protein
MAFSFQKVIHLFVMAGLVPAIRVFLAGYTVKTWMPGTRPGMTGFYTVPILSAAFRVSPQDGALSRKYGSTGP